MYAVLIALILGAKLLFDKLPRLTSRQRRLYFVASSFFFLFFLVAFRAPTVGTDMESYMNKFTLLREYPLWEILTRFYSERVEMGFALLSWITGLFTSHPQAIIVVSAAAFCIGMGHFVYRYADSHVFTAVILFACCGVYMYAFNITRQMIAVALLMNAWGLLTEKRLRPSLILFAVSLLFHITSFVFVLAYLFYFIREKKKPVAIIIGSGLFLVAIHRPLLLFLGKFMDAFSYMDNSKKKISASGIWAIWAIEIAIILLYLVYYFCKDTKRGKALLSRLPRPVFAIAPIEALCIPVFSGLYILFAILGTGFNYLDRLGVFFLPFCIFLFLNFGKRLHEQSPLLSRIYMLGLNVCFVAYFLLFATNLEHYRYAFMW